MSDWKHQHGLSDDDVEEMINSMKLEYLTGDLSEEAFRRQLGQLGLNASQIEEVFGGL